MFLLWSLILFFTILIIYQILFGCGKNYIIEGMETADSEQCKTSCDLPTVCSSANVNAVAIEDLKKRLDKLDQTSLQTQIDLLKKEYDGLNTQAQANANGQAQIANSFASNNSTPVTGANAYAPGPPQ
jgi:hypothetical protein